MSAGQKTHKKGRTFARVLGRVIAALCVLAIVVVGLFAFVYLRGDLEAPAWLRARVESGIAKSVPDGNLSFDDFRIRLEADARPIVEMRNAVLSDKDGQRIVELADMQASISLRGLLAGRVMPKDLMLSGVFLDVTRAKSGDIELNFNRGGRVSSASGPGVSATVLGVLDHPALSLLETVEIDAITLRFDDQRVERSWTVDGGRLRLGVDDDAAEISGDFALLSGRASAATVEANARLERNGSGVTFGISVADIPAVDLATQQASLAWLGVLDAPISGSIRGGLRGDGSLMPISTALKIGEGSVKPDDAIRGVPFRSAGSYFTYDPETQVLSFDEISVDSDWLAGRSEGAADLTLTEDGLPEGFEARFDFSALSATEGGLWGQEVAFDNTSVAFGLRLDPFEVKLHSAALSYQDADFSANGELRGGASGWSYVITGDLPKIEHDQLIALWPLGRTGKTREWLDKNVSGATYSDTSMTLNAEPGLRAVFGFESEVSDAQIRFAPTISPGEDVSGRLRMFDKRLDAEVASGRISPLETGGIDPAGTVFSIPDVTDRDGSAVVQLNGKGDLASVMAVLEQIPGLADDGTDLRELADGIAEFHGGLSFPIGRKPLAEEYKYAVEGTITEARSNTLLKDQTVESGLLTVNASNEQILVEGPAQIGGVEIDATWKSTANSAGGGSELTGQIELSQDFVHEFGLGLPDGMVNGQGTGVLQVDLPKGEDPVFEMHSDLSGVGLDLGFIGWRKPPDGEGQLTASGRLGDPLSIDQLAISAPGFNAAGRIYLHEDGTLDAVEFDDLKVADWLDGSVRIQGNGQGVAPDLYLNGGRVDVQALTEATGGIGATGDDVVEGRLFAELDELFVSDFLSLQNLSGEFDLGNNMQGVFAGRLNDTVEIAGAISSTEQGERQITVSADDAGLVFSALGLLDRASQGNILVELTEKTEGYGGKFVARDLRLLDMPLFADLLNAVSVVGLLDQLNFDGIAFGEVEGEFYFSEDKFILSRASATGPSIGLSLDGTYDFVNDQLDLQGTLTPVFLVNSIGGIFNRKGEGLIGFTFDVKGPADDPQINVNPFSALAPSLFRDIFRKPAPEVPE